MEKRPPFPLPPLRPVVAKDQYQCPQQGDSALEPSLLLLLSASSVAANASATASPTRPLPPVQALPLRVHLQQQPPLPLIPLMFAPPPLPSPPLPPLPPPPIRRKRILPRIVAPHATDEAATVATAAGNSVACRPPPVPMPVRRLRSIVTATASPALLSANVVTDVVADTTVALSPVQSSSSLSTVDSSAPESYSTAGRAIETAISPATATEEKLPKKKRIRIKTDRRREQCRANQARYRNKQRGEAAVLEERVEQLRAEVSNLERQRQLQYRGADASELPMQIVMEYFRLFRHGLSFEETDEAAARPSGSQQVAFLQSAMATDLHYGDFRGVDVLIEQWRRYSRLHGDLAFELESAFSVEKNAVASHRASYTIHATASLMLTITQATIQHVFPHVEPLAQLKARLLGKRVRYPCSLVFEFDESDKVQVLVCSMDYVVSLQQVLGNVYEVAALLANARIRYDFFLLGEGEELEKE